MSEEKLTIEKATVKLEEELKIIEEGKLEFEELIDHYETAVKMLAFCYERLEYCDGRIEDINKLIEKYSSEEDLFDE